MSAKENIPEPPENATEREKQLWKELINRMFVLKQTQTDVMGRDVETDTLANRYSEGDVVSTPDGDGVVVGVWNESWDDDGDTVEASDESPAYTVALVEGGYDHFSASDLESTEFDTDIDDPVDDIDAMADVMSADQFVEWDSLDWTMPDSWRESSKPARLILLDAWSSMGGQFDCGGACCMGELKSKRLCGAMKDEAVGTTAWRGWGPD